MIRCHAHPCREPGHESGTLAFCAVHFHQLTPNKRAKVVMIRSLNVLDVGSRGIANAVTLECRRYLATKQQRRAG
jgi:hypothetical protein